MELYASKARPDMASTTRQLSSTRAAVPWRLGVALRNRLGRVMQGFATLIAATQFGPDPESEIGRSTGGRI
jgi:hypothetical protein